MPSQTFEGFGGLVRSTDTVDRDGPPIAVHDERRLVEDKATGLSVWVTITQNEKRRIYNLIPKGWHRVVLDRESGRSVEWLADHYRMETERMRDCLALAYGWAEQQIYKLAERKAGFRR